MKSPLPPKKSRNRLFEFDSKYFQLFSTIAGVDEAGRGPLAGPVVACACLIERDINFRGINDSKQLSADQRAHFFKLLTTHPKVKWGMGVVDHKVIDEINIYQASLRAMREALDSLSALPDLLLVDGVRLDYKGIKAEKIVGGDGKSQMVAAASILAKESRDEMMRAFHLDYPFYGFDEHKGYPTPRHKEALKKYGPCPIHRLTYEPVKICQKT